MANGEATSCSCSLASYTINNDRNCLCCTLLNLRLAFSCHSSESTSLRWSYVNSGNLLLLLYESSRKDLPLYTLPGHSQAHNLPPVLGAVRTNLRSITLPLSFITSPSLTACHDGAFRRNSGNIPRARQLVRIAVTDSNNLYYLTNL